MHTTDEIHKQEKEYTETSLDNEIATPEFQIVLLL